MPHDWVNVLTNHERERARLAVNDAFCSGYNYALSLVASKLRIILAVHPEDITKADLRRMIQSETDLLEKRAKEV